MVAVVAAVVVAEAVVVRVAAMAAGAREAAEKGVEVRVEAQAGVQEVAARVEVVRVEGARVGGAREAMPGAAQAVVEREVASGSRKSRRRGWQASQSWKQWQTCSHKPGTRM